MSNINWATPGQRRWLWRIGKVIVVLVGIYLLLWLFFALDENHHKGLIKNELSKLSVPAGCKETSRQYIQSDLDARSTWIVEYTCPQTSTQLYTAITGDLKRLGYTPHADYVQGGPGYFYSFTYSNSKYTVDYRFLSPESQQSVDTNQFQSQANGPADGYYLEISEN